MRRRASPRPRHNDKRANTIRAILSISFCHTVASQLRQTAHEIVEFGAALRGNQHSLASPNFGNEQTENALPERPTGADRVSAREHAFPRNHDLGMRHRDAVS